MRTKKLLDKLRIVLDSRLLTYSDLRGVTDRGIYLVYGDNIVVYVGKTTRSGRIRLREMASDYRSHTLNRKLMLAELNTRFRLGRTTLKNSAKKELVASGLMTEDQFKSTQRIVNNTVREVFRFKFIGEEEELDSLEHFAIAVLRPLYND